MRHEYSEPVLWSATAALVATTLILALVAIRLAADLHESEKRGTLEAITSIENESRVTTEKYTDGSVWGRFFAAEQETAADQVDQLQKEL